MAKVLIRDGYTKTGRFPGKWGIPPVVFEYRDALPAAVNDFLAKIRNADGAVKTKAQIGILCSQIQSWDIEDEAGKQASVSEGNVRLLPHPLLEFLVDYVTGYKPDDAESDQKN